MNIILYWSSEVIEHIFGNEIFNKLVKSTKKDGQKDYPSGTAINVGKKLAGQKIKIYIIYWSCKKVLMKMI